MRNEMIILVDKLESAHIPFELTDDVMDNKNGQLWYPSFEKPVCDVICHKGSYGGKDGLLEVMGLTDRESGVEGWLTANEVFARIYTDYMNPSA